jgi:hypothetical protein
MKMHDLAKMALDQQDGDWSKAFALLMDWLEEDQQALEEVLRHGAWHAIQVAAAQVRQQYFRQAAGGEEYSGESQARTSGAALREIATRSWYNYQLPGGLRLGDADHESLHKAAERYRKLSESNAQRREFVDRVQGLLGDSEKTVEEVVRESDIESVAKETLHV